LFKEKKEMSGGFVKILKSVPKWISVKSITHIEKYDTCDLYEECGADCWDDLTRCVKCECKDGNCHVNNTYTCINNTFPIYCVSVGKVEYIVDPSENEKLERILEGTDNPMYEFVHELRYNPNSFMKGRELQEAKEDFEDQKKKRSKN
jgi:hypothetical protein